LGHGPPLHAHAYKRCCGGGGGGDYLVASLSTGAIVSRVFIQANVVGGEVEGAKIL